jgi:hypothetical protein
MRRAKLEIESTFSLSIPVHHAGKPPQRPLANHLPPIHRLQEQHLLLDVGREQPQIQDLGDLRSAQPVGPRQVGSILIFTAVDGALELGGASGNVTRFRCPDYYR